MIGAMVINRCHGSCREEWGEWWKMDKVTEADDGQKGDQGGWWCFSDLFYLRGWYCAKESN